MFSHQIQLSGSSLGREGYAQTAVCEQVLLGTCSTCTCTWSQIFEGRVVREDSKDFFRGEKGANVLSTKLLLF
jgi:hypothetical protein